MSGHESFEIKVGRGVVTGAVVMPDGDAPHSAVLVCSEFPGAAAGPTPFLGEIIQTLTSIGLAVACHAPRRNDADAGRRAASLVDDASAALRWMMLHDEIDADRIGLLGFRLSSIVAACLAGRTDRIRHVCLLEPTTIADLETRLARPDGAAPLLERDDLPDAFVSSLADLDPIESLARHRRSTLLLHGAADTILPPRSGRAYLDALEIAGHDVEHELVARLDSEFAPEEARAVCCERVRLFFAAALTAGVKA